LQIDGDDLFDHYRHSLIVARDKTSLDISWLKDDSLEDSDRLPARGSSCRIS